MGTREKLEFISHLLLTSVSGFFGTIFFADAIFMRKEATTE